MRFKICKLALGITALLLIMGCTTTPPAAITATVDDIATATITQIPTQTNTPTPEGPISLTIWVPPEFDPAADNRGANILQARLDEFTERRTDSEIVVRVKAIDGPSGLLESLTTASAAAPSALPDLVAMPRHLLEVAAIKGLLHPYNDQASLEEGLDWYDYALELGHLQQSTFGLPFAGNPMLFVYRTTSIDEPPTTYSATLTTPGTLSFPAADPQALYPIALYQAGGGDILDEQERPYLDQEGLQDVYEFMATGAASGLIPTWTTQLQDGETAWQAFLDNQSEMVIAWANTYLIEGLADTAATHVPTENGATFSLANGWVWALANNELSHQELSNELAEFLTESMFLSRWTTATGYFPPRPNAMSTWQTTSLRSFAHQVSLSAEVIPPADVLSALGQPIREGTIGVINQQLTPDIAAQTAADQVNEP